MSDTITLTREELSNLIMCVIWGTAIVTVLVWEGIGWFWRWQERRKKAYWDRVKEGT